ncbi:MAG: ABC transporter substrate-binding protein [Nitrosopumilus sp.]|nr:ABC transporter substrate-binding protein [Nitrosopumilus sp.]
MKSRQLLSVVFSLIMFTGVTAGSTAAAFAESDNDYDHDYDVIEDFEDCVEAGYPVMESFPEQCMTDDDQVFTNTEDDDDYNDIDETDDDRYDLDDRLEDFCEMTDEEKRQLFADHPRLEQFSDKLANYCNMDEDEREDALENFIDEHEGEFKKYHEDNMKEHLARYCEMSDADKRAFVAENDKAEDHVDKMNRYCELDEDGKADFIEEHKDEYREHMKEKMMDKKKHHMDYDRLCAMAEPNRAAIVDDAEKLERISQWCEMTPEEREDYKKEHHDKTNNEKHEMKMKLSEKSDRIKAMIMDKRDISDERTEEIKMKYVKKHGDLTDKQKSELKTKFEDHMKTMKHKISDERKSDIHDRLAEMKAFKAELREKSSDLTDEEKQQLREDFIEKAKDLQLAWITPRTQMTAGIDAAEVQCREGFSLVMKASNGVAMCLKADTALKMIDRGIAVPAN